MESTGLQTNEILGFAIDRAAAVNAYWNIFIAVATGILGIMASGKAFTSSRILKTFLSTAFIVFAYSNLDAIIRLGELREALLSLLSTKQPGLQAVVKSLSPSESWRYAGFHAFLDIVVLASIWFVPWPSSENKLAARHE